MSLASLACRQCRSLPRTTGLRTPSRTAAPSRRWFSEVDKPDTAPPPTSRNLLLAGALFSFVGLVFTYSMNAVGKSDAATDPLAQLKAEAQEARGSNDQKKILSKDEILALESGLTGGGAEYGDGELEVAVAAPADIAQLEEEANLKVFRSQKKQQGDDSEPKKKKPWYRFGF